MRILGCLMLVIAGVAFAPAVARADEAGDLVAKNLAARGGAAKLAAITSIQFTGTAIEPGNFELAYKETRARPNGAARIELSIQGLTLVQAYDGKSGWKINPFEGRRDAERMSGDETLALADDAVFDGPLLAAKARGAAVTYLGREDFEGTNTYKLHLTAASGAQYTYFLDPDTYLEIKVIESRTVRGAMQVQQSEYGDYELVNGVYFPFEIASGALGAGDAGQQKIVIASAVANIPVTAMMFTMPAAPSSK